jgi:hypothetical protein
MAVVEETVKAFLNVTPCRLVKQSQDLTEDLEHLTLKIGALRSFQMSTWRNTLKPLQINVWYLGNWTQHFVIYIHRRTNKCI